MSKSRKHRKHRNKTKKNRKNTFILPSSTPLQIYKISNRIDKSIKKGSYSPTINKQLINLKLKWNL